MKLVRTEQGYLLPVPQDVVQALGLCEGDEVGLRRLDDIESEQTGSDASVKLGIEIIRRFKGKVPAHFRFDRDEINAR